jgi:RNA polymerase sigma-70 factor (ECF subfamily)
MKIWGGLTFQEIAQTLAIPANTCASRYRYALEQLSQELQTVKEGRHEIA